MRVIYISVYSNSVSMIMYNSLDSLYKTYVEFYGIHNIIVLRIGETFEFSWGGP